MSKHVLKYIENVYLFFIFLKKKEIGVNISPFTSLISNSFEKQNKQILWALSFNSDYWALSVNFLWKNKALKGAEDARSEAVYMLSFF